ncbi:unnamed protein product [Durusdinium trenchii]|uniref:ubiquitinyl hydrolase 1 n=1 Tax=Durusdinium trenchii TaxID=1381693 RepID=A0ABP0PWR7_9DINO
MAQCRDDSPNRAKVARGASAPMTASGYSGTKLPLPLRFLRRSSSLNSAARLCESATPTQSSPRSKARPPPLPTLPSAARRLLSKGSASRASSLGHPQAERGNAHTTGRAMKSDPEQVPCHEVDASQGHASTVVTTHSEKTAWLGRARASPLPGLRALSGSSHDKKDKITGPKVAPSQDPSGIETLAAGPKASAPPLPPLDRIPSSLPEHVLEARGAGRVGICGTSPFEFFHRMRERRGSSEPPHMVVRDDLPSEGTSSSSKCSKRRAGEPVGLYNLGNTCFLNAAMQSLAHAPLLADYFLKGHFLKDLNAENSFGTGGEIASAFASLLQQLFPEGKDQLAVAPEELLRALCKHCPIVAEQPGTQQDAQEVMAFLLDALHEDLNRIREPKHRATASFMGLVAWYDHLQRHRSLVVDLCQGQLRSQVKCCECGCASVTFDPFLFLTLPLPPQLKRGRTVHIQEAIKAFCVEEKLQGEDCWGCPRCDRRVSASKRLSLWKLPLLLLVHLKRFGFEAGWGAPTWKIEGEVWTPGRLDLQDFVSEMSPQRVSLQYDLFAAVDHAGVSPFSGHYTASCLRPDGWWRFDDSRAEYLGRAGAEATEKKVIGPWNYLLLFQRRDAPLEPEQIPEQSHRRPELWPHVRDEAEEWSFMGDSFGSRNSHQAL